MKTASALLLTGMIILASGCATRGDAALGKSQGPRITKLKISLTNLGPDLKPEVTAREPDFVLLKIDVLNPEAMDAQGIIACLQDHKIKQRPLEHRFVVEPEKKSQYMVPVDELQSQSYTLRCRLEFQDELGNPHRSPSPWVRVKVPARS